MRTDMNCHECPKDLDNNFQLRLEVIFKLGGRQFFSFCSDKCLKKWTKYWFKIARKPRKEVGT